MSRLSRRLSWSPAGLLLRDGRALVRATRRQALTTLTEWLYQRLFTAWQPATGRYDGDVAGSPHFVDALATRAAGVTYLDEGFVLTRRTPTGVFVRNELIRLWVERPSAKLASAAGQLAPRHPHVGQRVSVRLPCARAAAVPGFFTVVSRVGRIPDGAHLKLYLNLRPDGALALVDALLHDKALATARFEAKVVNDPEAYARRDTALLYVDPPSWPAVTGWLRTFHQARRRLFRRGTPPLTLELARGLSAAESPTGSESFGEHRCRLVAAGLLDALRRNSPWAPAVARAFALEGLDFTAPWLGCLGQGWVDPTRRGWV